MRQRVAPVVVETEIFPANSVETDALSRLGATLSDTSVIMAAIALRLPVRFRDAFHAQLRADLRMATDLEYALFIGANQLRSERFPSKGWLRGTTEDLASLSTIAAFLSLPSMPLLTHLNGVCVAPRCCSDRPFGCIRMCQERSQELCDSRMANRRDGWR